MVTLPTPTPTPSAAAGLEMEQKQRQSRALLRPGCIVVADNVLSFGVPLDDYLAHVRSADGPFAASQLRQSSVEYSGQAASAADCSSAGSALLIDGVEISVLK